MNKNDSIAKVTEIVERAGRERGVEPVEVELVGWGEHRVLRIFIDKPEAGLGEDGKPLGVTHEDCQFISEYVGTVLDVEDVIPGGGYTLEVSSPGVERKLSKPRDFERHLGKKVKIVVREAIAGRTVWEGALAAFADGKLTVVASKKGVDETVVIPLDAVSKANLKFEW